MTKAHKTKIGTWDAWIFPGAEGTKDGMIIKPSVASEFRIYLGTGEAAEFVGHARSYKQAVTTLTAAMKGEVL